MNNHVPSDKDFKITTNQYFFEHFKDDLITELYKQAAVYYGHKNWYAVEFTTSFLDDHWKKGDAGAHLDIMMRTCEKKRSSDE